MDTDFWPVIYMQLITIETTLMARVWESSAEEKCAKAVSRNLGHQRQRIRDLYMATPVELVGK